MSALKLLSATLALGTMLWAAEANALNPQPEPPGRTGGKIMSIPRCAPSPCR